MFNYIKTERIPEMYSTKLARFKERAKLLTIKNNELWYENKRIMRESEIDKYLQSLYLDL